MQPKKIIAVVLLAFVGVSVAYLIVTESRSAPAADPASRQSRTAAPTVAPATPQTASKPEAASAAGQAPAAAETAPESEVTDAAEQAAPPSVAVVQSPAEAAQPPAEADRLPAHKLIAYYFHRTQRCHKCLTMEAYAEAALKEAFPQALASGELEWYALNVEEPANERFVEDYQLTSSALVLVDTWDGQQTEWRDLARVWELVGDELKFKAYVEGEALTLLEGGQ